jgi:hypothetical protein
MSTAKATKSTAMATVSSSSDEQQASALTLLLLLPVLYISYHLIKRALTPTKKKTKKPTTHGLKSHPLLGHLPAFLKNRHRFLDVSNLARLLRDSSIQVTTAYKTSGEGRSRISKQRNRSYKEGTRRF